VEEGEKRGKEKKGKKNRKENTAFVTYRDAASLTREPISIIPFPPTKPSLSSLR